jgi:predicted metal-dependent peptidase
MRKPEIKEIKLNPTQQKRWEDTKFALSWAAPAFTRVFYEMMAGQGKDQAVFCKDISVAATDGHAMLINPDTYFDTQKYTLHNRVFIGAHEILHNVLNHCGIAFECQKRGKVGYTDGTSLPYDDNVAQRAMDYFINAVLVDSKIGDLPPDGLYDTKIVTSNDSWLDAYRATYKKKPDGKQGKPGKQGTSGSNQGQGGGNQPGQGEPQPTGNFDEHLEPGTASGKDGQTAVNERNDDQWKAALQAGLTIARQQGTLPAALERLIAEVLEPKVSWRDHIEAFFARRIGNGRYDWRTPDRRLIVRDIIAPGKAGFGAEAVVVAIDTSGSIGQADLDMGFAELAGILDDVRPRRLVVIWCDARVDRVDELDCGSDLNDLRKNPGKGGGGTDFRPVFEEIEDMGIEPDALVYFTDSYGTFPSEAPTYPVLWGDITGATDAAKRYPFGDVVVIPKQASGY